MVEVAALYLSEDQDLAADRVLAQVLRTHPEFVPALVMRAELFGKRSMFAEGVEAWEKVLEHADPASGEARKARVEIQVLKTRLRLLQRQPEPPQPLPDRVIPQRLPTPVPMPKQPPQVKVTDIKSVRYAESTQYDALRMVTFYLQHQALTPAVDKGTVAVTITFYEQNDAGIRVADIPNAVVRLRISQGLSGGKKYGELSAAYEVPKGKSVDNRSYFGSVIRVFIREKEVYRASDSPVLLNLMKEQESP
jgi:hypothetical protein